MEGQSENIKTELRKRTTGATNFLAVFLFVGGWLFFGGVFATFTRMPLVNEARAGAVMVMPQSKGAGDNTTDTLSGAQVNDATENPDTLSAVSTTDNVYTVDGGAGANTMFITSWDISSIPASSTITKVVLHVKYGAEDGYNGTNSVRYDNGGGLANTSITPSDITGFSADLTYNLYAQGVDTRSEIQNLDVDFASNDTGAADAIHFDYLQIEVQYTALEQSAYRWFTNLDSTGVGSPLAAQDTSATLGNKGDAFRLRSLTHAAPADWSSFTIASKSDVGQSTSIYAVNSSTSFISYYDVTNADLKFAKSTDGGKIWRHVTVDSTGSIGSDTSIYAIDANTIFISYYDATNFDLKFAKSTDGGATWPAGNIKTVDATGDVGKYTSLYATDANTIFISYYDATNIDLKFAKSTDGGATWPAGNIKTVDATGSVGFYNSLYATDANTIFISYFDETNIDLKFAKSTDGGATWPAGNIKIVDAGVTGYYTSLYATDANTIFISYGTGGLQFAKSTDGGATWPAGNIKTVDAAASARYTSLHATDANTIFISYYDADATDLDLKFAKSTDGGATWPAGNIKTLDTTGDVGRYNSLYATDANTIFISYYDATNLDLKFAKYSVVGNLPLPWDATNIVDSTGDVGRYNSLYATDVNTIFVSYYDNTNFDLKFAKSTDGGATWPTGNIKTVDSTGNVGQDTSIYATDASTVFISYFDSTNGDLKFAKSTDGGATWPAGSIKTIDSAGDLNGKDTSIYAIDANTIFISYNDGSLTPSAVRDLKFAKSTDGGATWPAGNIKTVDATGDVGKYTSLYATDANTIFISYYADTNLDLKFAKSTDGGATWPAGNIQTVDSTNDVGKYNSLYATDANTIFVSYYNNTNGDLKFAKSTDGGATWPAGNIKTVDATGLVGLFTSLHATDANTIFVSYNDNTNGDLKFAQSTDGGATWPAGNIQTVDSTGKVGSYTSLYATDASTIFISYFDSTNDAVFDLKFARRPSTNSLKNFKLQFAQRGADNSCDTSFSNETYIDVGTTTSISFYGNATPADGAALTASANDPEHGTHATISQTYEEANNFTNFGGAVASGSDGLWDLALYDKSTNAGETYCFRVVKADSTPTLLDTYTKMPEVTTATFSSARGNTENTGVITETLSVPFKESWSVTADNPITLSSPVATATKLFIGDDGGKFYAVNTATGSVAWTFNAGNPINVSPTVEGSTVYFGDTGNKFYGRNISDGAAVFTHTASAAISASPVINGDNILFGLGGVGVNNLGTLVAINKSSGAVVWTKKASNSFGNFAVAATGSLGFAADTGGRVYKFDTTNGTVSCAYAASADSFSRSSPVVSDNTIFIGSDGGLVYAINAANCALYNTFNAGSDIIATPVYDATNNKLYVGTIGGALYRLNFDHGGANTFSQDWKVTIGTSIESSSILTTGGTARLFVGADTWYVFSPADGSYIWSSPIGRIAGSSIGVTGDAIFTANAAGKIYYFKETKVQGAFVRAWNYNTTNQITTATRRVGSNVYVGTADKKLHSVTTAGVANWSFTASASIVTVRPEVDSTNGVVYFGTEDGQFWAVNTSNGTRKWQKDIGGLVTSQPVVEPSTNTIYVPSTRGKFYSLNATTGATNQIYDTGLTGYNISSPIITATGSFFTYGNRALVSLNKTNFTKTWEFSMGGSNITDNPIYITSSTSATSPRFFVGGVDGVYAVNGSGGQVWKRAVTSPITAVTYDTGVASRAYATTQDGRVIGIKVSDGVQLWSTTVASASVPVSRPEIYQDVLFVNADKETRALAGEDGKVRTRFNLNLPSLAPTEVSSTDGQLFIGQIGGNVENFDTASYSMDVTRANGGTLTTIFNDQLVIPSNSINADATVQLDVDDNNLTPGAGTAALPRKYKFIPSTATFSPAATFKVAYKTSDLKGEPESDIRLFLFQSGTNTYEEKTGTLDTANKLFSVSLTAFSRFAPFIGIPKELKVPILAMDSGYKVGDWIVLNYGPRTGDVRNVRAYLNGKYVKSGRKVTLNKAGKNIFVVTGRKANGKNISHRQEFIVNRVSRVFASPSPFLNGGAIIGR